MVPGSAVGEQAEDTDEQGGPETTGEAEEMAVSAFESSPDRMVFTEEGNPDGWIATDLAMDPPR